jgi:EAL domain-containing protein (putative c-di-GMP-specific phosphodiesterase class I)
MRSEVAERFRMEGDLREAIEDGNLGIAFQPMFNLEDRSLSGYEALVRWTRDGIAVPPDVFVVLAEETGLVGRLGEFVLSQAVAFLNTLATAGIEGPTVSVNVSPLQFADSALLDQVRSAVLSLRTDASRLILEITETALLGDPDTARTYLHDLRAHGVRIALDDFGMGYSSLSTLRGFPLDGVKIDRAFISELSTNTRDQSIVSAMTALGHALGMYIVAEGAETEADVAAAAELGCDRLQGFALSRPLDTQAALALAHASVPVG